MHFLSSLYRNIKLTIASLSGLAGLGALIAGIVIGSTGGTVLIVGGSLWVVTSGFSIFDSVAAHSAIKKDVDRLEKNVDIFGKENLKLEGENTKLAGSVERLEIAKDRYIEENKKLATSVKQSQDQVKKLSDLKTQYEEANQRYEELLEKEKSQITELENQNLIYVDENSKLSASLTELQTIKNTFEVENEKYKTMLEDHKTQINALESAKNDYVAENDKLQKANEESAGQLEMLKNQVVKLRELYNNSRELLVNLSSAGDMFSQFGNTLGASVTEIQDTAQKLDDTQEGYDQTLDQMRQLIEKLKTSTYEDLDVDGDGNITKEEFDKFIQGN